MAANGISTLATKELRQKAKLALAAQKRAIDGNARATYDITQLPTQYNDNDIIDNPNTGGLVQGRPWITTPVEIQLETFTVVQTTDWTAPAGTTSVEYLVVGGGGGGGNGYDTGGGGGGAGGMMLTGTLAVTPGQTYTVIVGDGGTGGADERVNNAGTAGSNSVFATITALGGTGGQGSRTYSPTARYTGGAAQVGFSTAPLGGGGGGAADAGGGGGGAGGAGGTRVSAASAGVGGAGVASSITGSSVTYGRGGAGGTSNVNNNDGAVGANNTGTGGGGGSATAGNSGGGGNGGSGIVVLKFTTAAEFTFFEAFGTTSAIETTQYVIGNKIYAYSSTYDVPGFQPARVVVNDIQVLLQGDVPNPIGRGHNLVVLDSNGDVVVPATQFDTYIDPANLTALASALDSVPSGYIVVLVVYDASTLNAAVRTAINTGYGSTNTTTWVQGRNSHIFIGVKIREESILITDSGDTLITDSGDTLITD
jgi:hypothetical protein